MLKIVETVGNALYPKTYKPSSDESFPIIMHQCNTNGVMGSGFAAQVKELAVDAYHRHIMEHKFFGLKLGTMTFGYLNVDVGAGIVANCQTQIDNDQVFAHTSYEHILQCCNYISTMVQTSKRPLSIVIPKNYGCGIANGNWEQVRQIFINAFRHLNTTLYIVEYKTES
jgi:hypothetical protein